MSIPLFPSLRPNIMSAYWGDLDPPVDEEAEILELEQEQRNMGTSLGQMFGNPIPIGKTSYNPEEEELEGVPDDDDDDETSSDDLDDIAPRGMFRIHDNLSPPQMQISPTPPADIPSPPHPATDDSSSLSSSSSESDVTVTLNSIQDPAPGLTTESATSVPLVSSGSSVGPVGRPTRVIVGRHTPALRPGMPRLPPRFSYIDTSRQQVNSGRPSSGSVSPTSRAYINAALQSPPGEVDPGVSTEVDGSEMDVLESASYGGRPESVSQSSPEPDSEFHQMVPSVPIYPTASSNQVDNLIEPMHQQAQAARTREYEEDDKNSHFEARLTHEPSSTTAIVQSEPETSVSRASQ